MGFFSKVFNTFTYKGVVDTQIDIYNKLKKQFPDKKEDDILNMLIMTRIKSAAMLKSQFPLSEMEKYYGPLLKKKSKGLDDVLSSIVWYEYIESRSDWAKKFTILEKQMFVVEVCSYISGKLTENKHE